MDAPLAVKQIRVDAPYRIPEDMRGCIVKLDSQNKSDAKRLREDEKANRMAYTSKGKRGRKCVIKHSIALSPNPNDPPHHRRYLK